MSDATRPPDGPAATTGSTTGPATGDPRYDSFLERGATRGTEAGADAVLAGARHLSDEAPASVTDVASSTNRRLVVSGLAAAAILVVLVAVLVVARGRETEVATGLPGGEGGRTFRVAYVDAGTEVPDETLAGSPTPTPAVTMPTAQLEATLRARLAAAGFADASVVGVGGGAVEVRLDDSFPIAAAEHLIGDRGVFALAEMEAGGSNESACDTTGGGNLAARQGRWPTWGPVIACYATRGLFGIARTPADAPLAPGSSVPGAPRPSVSLETGGAGTTDVVLRDLATPLPSFGTPMCVTTLDPEACPVPEAAPPAVVAFVLDATIVEIVGMAGAVTQPTSTRFAGLDATDARALQGILGGGAFLGPVTVTETDIDGPVPGTPPTGTEAPTNTEAPTPSPARSCVPDPSVFPVDLSSQPTPDEIMAEQGYVMPDLDVANAYGAAHADEFSGVVNLHGPERVAVAFTDHLDEHRAALLAQVPHPDRLVVVRGCMAEAELRQMQNDITVMRSVMDVLVSSTGDAIGGFVSVNLRSGGEDAARELLERYGEKVSVTLGTKAYPPGSPPPVGWYTPSTPAGDVCSRGHTVESPIDGLEVVPEPESTTIQSGASFKGTIRITNNGSAPITLEGGKPETAILVKPGTRQVVAVYTGGIAGVGWGATLAPGQSAENTFIGTTDACEADQGYVLVPGTYGLIVPLTVGYERGPGGGATAPKVQWSTEVPITIVPT